MKSTKQDLPFAYAMRKLSWGDIDFILDHFNDGIMDSALEAEWGEDNGDVDNAFSNGDIDQQRLGELKCRTVVSLLEFLNESIIDAELTDHFEMDRLTNIIQRIMVTCDHEDIPDELNPKYMFQTIDTILLAQALDGQFNVMDLIRQELENRGVKTN
jgi:hypothetical protein